MIVSGPKGFDVALSHGVGLSPKPNVETIFHQTAFVKVKHTKPFVDMSIFLMLSCGLW